MLKSDLNHVQCNHNAVPVDKDRVQQESENYKELMEHAEARSQTSLELCMTKNNDISNCRKKNKKGKSVTRFIIVHRVPR